MRFWMDEMVMTAIGKLTEHTTTTEAIAYNYGIKESLRHLSFALYCRFPKFWTRTKPLRTLAKKLYRFTKKIIKR